MPFHSISSELGSPEVFDVRSLIPFVVTLDGLILASVPRPIDEIAAVILAIILVLYRAWGQLIFLAAAALVMLGGKEIAAQLDGPLAGGVGVALGYVWRYVLAGCFGWFLVTHASPTQFMAAMTRLRFPRMLLVPIAVVMRFIPTVGTEARAIGDSMRMRGLLSSPLTVAAHPVRSAEYLVIPLLSASVRAGDELAASALSRGFGAPGVRTTIVEMRMRWMDAALLILGVAVCAYAFGIGG